MEKKGEQAIAGCGPPFEVTDLPEPPRDITPRKVFAILGPAVIALDGTIGGGEWLIGPYDVRQMWARTPVGDDYLVPSPGVPQFQQPVEKLPVIKTIRME